jgi:hypothetical protein
MGQKEDTTSLAPRGVYTAMKYLVIGYYRYQDCSECHMSVEDGMENTMSEVERIVNHDDPSCMVSTQVFELGKEIHLNVSEVEVEKIVTKTTRKVVMPRRK